MTVPQLLLRAEGLRSRNVLVLIAATGIEPYGVASSRSATLGGVDLPAGTTVMLLPGAANRDPRRFDCPAQLRMDRPNARQNVAFARGVHSCPGGPLARIEGRVTVERILDRLDRIQIDAAHHGPPGDRRFDYVPLYILRGLEALHLKFTATP